MFLMAALLASGIGAATARAARAPWYPLFQAINHVRAKHHLRPVQASSRLHWAARHHSSHSATIVASPAPPIVS